MKHCPFVLKYLEETLHDAYSYNQASTNLAFHSNETSKNIKLPNKYLLMSYRCTPNYTKTCSFLHAHYTETYKNS